MAQLDEELRCEVYWWQHGVVHLDEELRCEDYWWQHGLAQLDGELRCEVYWLGARGGAVGRGTVLRGLLMAARGEAVG